MPTPVRRALRKLGQNLNEARRRRRIPMRLAAERASISRATLGKIEKGDEAVSLGAYVKTLYILGMLDRLNELTDPSLDRLGLELEALKLPRRVRIPKKERG